MIKDLKVPNGWGDIKISQFIELDSIDKDADWIDVMVQNTSILLDIDSDTIENMDISDVKDLFKSLSWASVPPNCGPSSFKYEGVEYKLMADFNLMTFGEWIDLETLCKDNNAVKNLNRVLSILYKVDGEVYDASVAKKRAELFLNVSVADVYHSILFFLLFAAECTNSTKDYSWLEETWTPMMKQISDISAL
jgi:hypothetical protein